MAGSRTIKTLTALLVSMTVGSFLLMLLAGEQTTTKPIVAALPAPSDESVKLITDTRVPVRLGWTEVVIHSSNVESPDIAKRVHFIIDADGKLQRTDLWARQMDGNHVFIPGGDWNSISIGVLVISDPSRKKLQGQSDTLEKLVESLRQVCRIPDSHVYRHAQLPNSPAGCGMFN